MSKTWHPDVCSVTSQSTAFTVGDYLWHKTAVPIFLERFLLVLCAGAIILLLTNPMAFDKTQRITLGAAVVLFAYFLAHTIYTTKPNPVVEKPDITVRIVNPKAVAIMVVNDSPVLARDIRYTLIVWNLDSDRVGSLPILDRTADWIRAGEFIHPETFVASPQVTPLVKDGDRLLGIADVSCPECVKSHSYWVYAVHSKGGWFAEAPAGRYPDPSITDRLIPQIKNDPEKFLRDIPESERVTIDNYPSGK